MRRKRKQDTQVSKRPANVAFKQQRLAAWQPILTPQTVLPVLFIIGLVFVPLGAVFLVASNSVVEFEYDYTNCTPAGSTVPCANVIKDPSTIANQSCECTLDISVPQDIDGQVYLYYKLERFYQNHRRYVKSRDDSQLYGRADAVQSTCSPLDKSANGTTYAPCGYIANSMFNDTITLLESDGITPVAMNAKGIAWTSDFNTKFGNPTSWANTVPPPNWQHAVNEFPQVAFYPELTQGYTNQDFIVWMRTAALPSFRKLYRKLNSSLTAGSYQLRINYTFPVTSFEGKKKVVLTNTSWLGGKNIFLGIAYIVVGCLTLLVAVALLGRHMLAPRQLGDHKYLAWDR